MSINKYKTKKGVRYQAILHLKGKRIASKGGFETKRAAKRWLSEEETAWNLSAGATKTDMDFESLARVYLDEIEDRRKRNTYIYKRSTFRRIIEFYDRLPLSEINRTVVAEYIRTQKDERGPKAANRDLKEMVTLFNWAIRQGLMMGNPARQVEPYAEETYVRYVPPAEDIAAARMAATPQERNVIDTLYYTAARLSEILEMTWEDVNFEAGAIRLWTSKRRGGNKEPRVLAMHNELQKLLKSMWNKRDTKSPYVFVNENNGQPFTRHTPFIRDLFSTVCKRAEIEPFTAHCIRHHVASRLADSRKATARQIQLFLGHMNLKTTETYLHELQVDHDILTAFDDPKKDDEEQADAQ